MVVVIDSVGLSSGSASLPVTVNKTVLAAMSSVKVIVAGRLVNIGKFPTGRRHYKLQILDYSLLALICIKSCQHARLLCAGNLFMMRCKIIMLTCNLIFAACMST